MIVRYLQDLHAQLGIRPRMQLVHCYFDNYQNGSISGLIHVVCIDSKNGLQIQLEKSPKLQLHGGLLLIKYFK